MEKKPKIDVGHMISVPDMEIFFGRTIPQAFWDEWLKAFQDDVPEPSLFEQLTVLRGQSMLLPDSQKSELSIVIRNAIGQWAQEKLDGLPRSKESR